MVGILMFAALGIVTTLQRFAIMVGLAIAVGGAMAVTLKVHDARIVHDAVTQRDALWTNRLAAEREAAQRDAEDKQKRTDEAAAAERAKTLEAMADVSKRAEALEQIIAASKVDPVVFPKAMALELRR